jgi:hypothetical protein
MSPLYPCKSVTGTFARRERVIRPTDDSVGPARFTEAMKVTRASLALSAVAVLAALIGMILNVSGLGAVAVGPVAPGHVSLVLLGGLAPAALASAVAMLLPRRRAIVITLIVLGYAAVAVSFVSFSVGFDEADGEVPPGPLGAALMPALVVAYLALAAAAALAVSTVLPLRPLFRTVIVVPVGLVSAPFLIMAGIGYSPLLLTVGGMLTLVLVAANRTNAAETVAAGAPPAASMTRGIRIAAVMSLAITLVAFGGGISAGIALDGTPGATRALGLMLAIGNLAAVPLLVAVTLLLAPRRFAARIGMVAGSLGIATCCGYLILQDDPADPFAFTVLVALAGSVGVWAGAIASARATAVTAGSRALIAALVGIGVAIGYFVAVIGSAGGLLAAASGYLAFRGIRNRHPAPAVS